MTTATKTKEHPILFSSDMIRAILDGRKTQTRRVIKPQPKVHDSPPCNPDYNIEWTNFLWSQRKRNVPSGMIENCPYGQPGHELWVRETFASLCKEGDPYCWCETEEQKQENHFIQYKADTWHEFRGEGKYDKYPGNWDDAPYPPGMNHHPAEADYIPRWKPSIHMPREASRIQLEVEDIHVERVQEITEGDVEKEGAEIHWRRNLSFVNVDSHIKPSPTKWFRELWDSINADRGYPWEANPWVWVVQFKVKEVKT